MTLGLRRHTVELRPHDPAWGPEGRKVIDQISQTTGVPSGRIEHVGSTAVPDLVAKPILDIDVGTLADGEAEQIADRLVEIGYLDRGQKDGGIGRLLVWESAPNIRTIHVHVVPHDSESWRRDVAFRDALKSDADLRLRYGNLKSEIASLHPESRRSYRRAKNPFILMHFGLPDPEA